MNKNSGGEASKYSGGALEHSGEASKYSSGDLEHSGGASEHSGGDSENSGGDSEHSGRASENSDGSSGDLALRIPTVSSFLDVVCAFSNEVIGAGENQVQTVEVGSHGASTSAAEASKSGERSGGRPLNLGDHGHVSVACRGSFFSGGLRADAIPYYPYLAQSSSIGASDVIPYNPYSAQSSSIGPLGYDAIPASSSISLLVGNSEKACLTRKNIRVASASVGAIIGKRGQIRLNIQEESGAKIVIAQYSDADPSCLYREVDLIGTPRQIAFAEYLINETIAENHARNPAISSLQQFHARPSCGWTPGIPPVQQPGPGGYQARPQSGYGQPPAYGQHGYPSASCGVVNNPAPDVHTSSYGYQGESAQAPPVQPASFGQQAYNASQQPRPNPSSYLPQPDYGVHLTSQAGNGTILPAQAAYGVGYRAPPMQQPPVWSLTTPIGYGQPSAVLPGYPDSQPLQFDYAQVAQAPPRSSHDSVVAQASYGAPPCGQPGYGQAPPSGQPGYGSNGGMSNPAPGAHVQFGSYSGPIVAPVQQIYQGGSSNEHQQRHGETATTRSFKTKLCKYWDRNNWCYHNEKCKLAHGLQELVRHPLYKTEPCMMLMQGYCRDGEDCFYRHDLNK